jgi:hypothetical protein
VNKSVQEILENESLEVFLAAMRDFDQAFVDALSAGIDFTIKLEVRGDLGEMLHARLVGDRWRRPSGVERRMEQAKKMKKRKIDGSSKLY